MITKFWTLTQKHQKKILLFSLLVVVVFGVTYSIYLGDTLRFLPDESDYLLLAENLVKHHRYAFPEEMGPIWPGDIQDGLISTAFRAPGYPLMLAFFTWLGLGIFGLRLVNFVFLALSLFLIVRILQEHGMRAPSIGVILVLAYPVLLYTASTLYPQTLGGLLFLAVIYFTSAWKITTSKMVLGGFLWGGLVLAIPLFLLPSQYFLVGCSLVKKPHVGT